MDDSDELNDETFGDAATSGPPGLDGPPGLGLPDFFTKNSGVTILDELAGLSMTDNDGGIGGLEDEDYGNMEGTFNTDDLDEEDKYVVDEKLPDFFSTESKMYESNVLDMNIGRDTTEDSSKPTFPLPAGAHVIDPSTMASVQNVPPQPPQQQQQQPAQQQQQQQPNPHQVQQQQPMQPSPYQHMQPPPQILLCPPGALPPPQSISSLSTPGQMQVWHQQQQQQQHYQRQMQHQRHLQQQHQYQLHLQQQRQRQQQQQQFPPQGQVAPGLGTNSVAQGLPPLPPTPATSTTSDTSDPPAPPVVRRGPPAVKGGVAPPETPSPPAATTTPVTSTAPPVVPIASGLSGQGQPLQLQQPPPQQQQYPQPFPPPRMVPQQQFRHVAQQQKGPRLPCGSRMNHSDVRFVVGKVMQTTETHDPFNDDFYFIQLSMRRHGAKLDKAIAENTPLPAPLPIPLPTWTETKKRIRTQLDESRQHYEDRSRKWEIQEKVLGHNVKSDVSKPRAVLSVPRLPVGGAAAGGSSGTNTSESTGDNGNSLDDMINGLDEEPEEGTQPAITPFVTVLWNMRGAVHRGYGALYVAQELRQLLNTPLVNAPNNAAIRADIIQEANAAVALVCKSVGLKEPTNTINASTDFLSKIQTNSTSGVLLDGGLVAALLQTTKGKKLMRRSICLLHASQRWTLLPVLVARILQRDPDEQSKEDIMVEAALLATIIDFIQFEDDCIVNRVEGAHTNNIPPGVLLVHLRQCIKSVMVSQMETKSLRKALVSSRKRAEVMHIILRLGDQIVTHFCREEDVIEEGGESMALHFIDPQRKADWTQLRDAFMLMLEN